MRVVLGKNLGGKKKKKRGQRGKRKKLKKNGYTRSTQHGSYYIKHDAFHIVVRKRLNRRRLSVPSSSSLSLSRYYIHHTEK
jgi:hypothetical protein